MGLGMPGYFLGLESSLTLLLTIKKKNSIVHKVPRSSEYFQEGTTKLITPVFVLTLYLIHFPLHYYAFNFMSIFPAALKPSEGQQLRCSC